MQITVLKLIILELVLTTWHHLHHVTTSARSILILRLEPNLTLLAYAFDLKDVGLLLSRINDPCSVQSHITSLRRTMQLHVEILLEIVCTRLLHHIVEMLDVWAVGE